MAEYSAPVGAPIWFDLMSSDPDKAAEFYGQIFGWEAEEAREEFGGYRNFRRGGARVAGLSPYMEEAGGPANVWSFYLHTEDPDATAKNVEAAGGSIMFPPMAVGDEGTMMVAVDSAGAVVGFWKPNQHPGFTEWGVHGAPYWFELASNDYPKSIAFYSEVVGARADTVIDNTGMENPPSGPLRYSQLFFGESAYGGIMDANGMFGDAPSFWQIYICVDDVAATVALTEKLGGEVVMPGEDTPYGTLAVIKDPLGALICLGHPPAGM
ncbi:VOC family protein [Gordonia sp. VNQ95]|uniref:VOC family protein n=1 Tax=Gordonia sp. VNQ95 TaxID=3156619 RepID=UPI0032B47183